MARNDSSQHSDGEELDVTEHQATAINRIRAILDTLPPEPGEAFQKYLKGLIHGEKGSEEKCGDFSEAEDSRQSDDAGSDHSGD